MPILSYDDTGLCNVLCPMCYEVVEKKMKYNYGVRHKRVTEKQYDNFVGELSKAQKRSNKWSISTMTHYDPEFERCKLCYEEVYVTKSKDGRYFLRNKGDNELHKKRIGKHFYCTISKIDPAKKWA